MTGASPESPEFPVRAARPGDAGEIARLVRARCAHDGETSEHVDPAFLAGALFDAAGGGAPALRAVVAEGADGSGLVGHALWHVAFEAVYSARGAYVVELYVDAALRRRGVARALLAAAARAVRAEGGSYLWWTTGARNHLARGFYDGIADVLNDQAVFYALTREAFERLAARA